MKNKGFTLAEVLGVIIILGILVIVSFPPMLNQLKKSQNKLNDATLKILGTAAEQYIDNHATTYPMQTGKIYCLKLETLVNAGYLKSPILDAGTGEEIDEKSNFIKFMVDKDNEYKHTYELVTECEEN